ncbi:MAG: ABC transporter permease, partial [Desulfotignum sp.]|nr:ABC transporter permease [Desulfotignum sp.]
MPEKIETNNAKTKKVRLKEMFAILLSSKIAMVGLVIVLFWVFVALFAPYLTPYTPFEQDWKAPNQGPSAEHILGTDELGRDLWTRLIYGARVVLVVLPVSENISLPGGTAIWG